MSQLDMFPSVRKVDGKVFRLENQTPEEMAGDSCAGCAFSVERQCAAPGAGNDNGGDCVVNIDMVWKEISRF